MHDDVAGDLRRQRVSPPRPRHHRTHVYVVRPTCIARRYPEVNPEVAGLQEYQAAPAATASQRDIVAIQGGEHLAQLTTPENRNRSTHLHNRHRRFAQLTQSCIVVEFDNLVVHEARGKYGAQSGSGSGTWRHRHQGPSGTLGSKCIRHPISSSRRSPFCMLWRRHAATTLVHS